MRVAYVLLRFPQLTQTFVYREIWELKQQNVEVQILSLLGPKPGLIQPVARQLASDASYAPTMCSLWLWWAHLFYLVRRPGLYLGLLAQLVTMAYGPKPVDSFLKRIFLFLKAVGFAHRLKNAPVDLIHTHFAEVAATGAWVISRLLDLPFTVTPHAFEIYMEGENYLLCPLVTSATHVVGISDYGKKELLTRCPGLNENAISVIRCGIDPEKLMPVVRVEKPIPSIVSVGRLIEKKGHEYLIDACGLLKQGGVDFDCTIIGDGPQETVQALEQLVRDFDLSDYVFLRGACDFQEVMKSLANGNLFVLACVVARDGDRDGIPVSLIEAAAMALPVISTPVSGIPELLKHGETGWIVPERDAHALANAIEALAADAPLREQLGRNARAWVEQEFNIHKNVAKLSCVFRQVISDWSRQFPSRNG